MATTGIARSGATRHHLTRPISPIEAAAERASHAAQIAADRRFQRRLVAAMVKAGMVSGARR
jgi:hypothetical protein